MVRLMSAKEIIDFEASRGRKVVLHKGVPFAFYKRIGVKPTTYDEERMMKFGWSMIFLEGTGLLIINERRFYADRRRQEEREEEAAVAFFDNGEWMTVVEESHWPRSWYK